MSGKRAQSLTNFVVFAVFVVFEIAPAWYQQCNKAMGLP